MYSTVITDVFTYCKDPELIQFFIIVIEILCNDGLLNNFRPRLLLHSYFLACLKAPSNFKQLVRCSNIPKFIDKIFDKNCFLGKEGRGQWLQIY